MNAIIAAALEQPKIQLGVLISLVIFDLASNNATAATVEYVCEPDETIITKPSEDGMSDKIDMSGAYTVILSLGAEGKGSSTYIIEGRAPFVKDGYTVTQENGSIRWLTDSAGSTAYILFTESMQMNHLMYQVEKGLPTGATRLTKHQCRFKQ